jgi:hypothetical protein
MATAASIRKPSFQAVGALGPAFQMWAPGEPCSSAIGTGELSLWVVGTLGPNCQQATRNHGSSGEPSLWAAGILISVFWPRLPEAQSNGSVTSTGGTKPEDSGSSGV